MTHTQMDDLAAHTTKLREFAARNSKAIRTLEIKKCTRILRGQYEKVGAVGFCFGGWASFMLGNKDDCLIDCLSIAHSHATDKRGNR